MRLKKKKHLHSNYKIVSLRRQRFLGIQMYKINFVSRDLYACCGPVCSHAPRTCLFTDTHSYLPDDIVDRALWCTTHKKTDLLSDLSLLDTDLKN